MDKPRIFLGSSGMQKKLVQALTRGLEDVAQVDPWTTSLNPGTTTLARLFELAHEVDFAAFVFARDDWTAAGLPESPPTDSGQASPRDNVVFEAGLFGGVLGMNRIFILHATGAKLPSDLLGFIVIRYAEVTNSEIRVVNEKLRKAIENEGGRVARIDGLWWQFSLTERTAKEPSALSLLKISRDRNGALELTGRSWREDGSLSARYWCEAVKERKEPSGVFYYWKGERPRDPNAPQLDGTGEILLESADRAAGYFTTRSDTDPNLNARTAGVYWRADPEDMAILDGNDDARSCLQSGCSVGGRSRTPENYPLMSRSGHYQRLPISLFSPHRPLKSGANMRQRKFTWLVLTALAISMHLAGTSHAWAQYWSPYRSWWGDHTFRQKYQRGYKKPDLTKKAQPQADSKGASKDTAKGPLLVIISIADQRISLYDNGALVARSSVSTGVKNHPTPLGVFSVISKSRFHRSNIYSNAPMPYMQRITWSGIALHAGDLPGYPASHGCIRLTNDFAVRLFHLTKRGTRVIIAHDDIRPAEIRNANLFVPKPKVASASPQSGTAIQSGNAMTTADATDASLVSNAMKQEDAKVDAKVPDPASGAAAPQKGASISVFVSRKLSKLFVRQGFTPLFDVPVRIQNGAEPMGTHVFTAMEFQNDGAAIRWTVVSIPEKSSHSQRTAAKSHKGRETQTIKTVLPTPDQANAALNRIEIPQDAVDRIAQLLTSGSSLIISDHGISGETGQDTDFIVLTR